MAWCLSFSLAWAATVTQVATGHHHTLAVMSDGSLWAWGDNSSGQLGNNSLTSSSEPIKIGIGYTQVAAGAYHSLALMQDGSLWTWGSNASGELGNGTNTNARIPVRIGAAYVRIAAGAQHSLALKDDGTLWAWGSNGNYQLGNGDTRLPSFSNTNVPVQVLGSDFVHIAAGGSNSAAIQSDGSLWTWGSNDAGQLGDGTYTGFGAGSVPKQTSPGVPLKVGQGFMQVSVGAAHMAAVKTDGSLWVWGTDVALENGVQQTNVGQGYAHVSAGLDFSLATKTDGSLWAWGLNASGQLGDGKGIDLRQPTQIGAGFAKASASKAFAQALRLDGSLVAWGSNPFGQFGIPNAESVSFDPLDVALGTKSNSAWQAQVVAIGTSQQSTLLLQFQPEALDMNQAGHVFVVAALPTGALFTLTSQGWSGLDLAQPQSWFSGIQIGQTTLLRHLNLSGLKGLMIFVGYGLGDSVQAGFSEMLGKQRFKLAYSVQ